MGQKIHPSGFRVGITKKHQSQWFARFNKNKYSQTVLEDRMIRDTLHKLFPELLNPTSKLENKRDQNANVKKARITQIKIERNIVPYEIGIQIHAENCKLLKSTIKNLQVKREIIVKLQKTRQYLTNLKTKLDNLTNNASETRLKTNGSRNPEHRTKKQDGTKLSKIKTLRKKLSNIKASNTKLWESSSRKKLSKRKLAFGTKQTNSLSKRSLNKLFKIKLLKAKLSKLIQISPPPCKTSSLFKRGEGASPTLKLKGDHVITPPSGPLRGKVSQKKLDFKRKSQFGALHTKLTKRQLKRKRIFKKRLRLRKFIRLRDRLAISKGLLIQKRGRVGFGFPGGTYPRQGPLGFLSKEDGVPQTEREKKNFSPFHKKNTQGQKIIKKLVLSPTPRFLKDFSLNPKVYLLPVQKIEKNWLLGGLPYGYKKASLLNPYPQKSNTLLSTKKNLNSSPTGEGTQLSSNVAEIMDRIPEGNFLKKGLGLKASRMGLLYPRLFTPPLGGAVGGRSPTYPKPELNFSNIGGRVGGKNPVPFRGKAIEEGRDLPLKKNKSKFKTNIYNSRLQKKIVTLYIEQMKRRFLPHLNDLFLQYTNQKSPKNVLSLGYLKKWNFKLRAKKFKNTIH